MRFNRLLCQLNQMKYKFATLLITLCLLSLSAAAENGEPSLSQICSNVEGMKLLVGRETNHDFTPGNVCKLQTLSYSHDSFINFMCMNKAFLDMIENHADHDKHAGFKCNTDHVKVEHKDRMKNRRFIYKHCEKNTAAVKKIANFNNHDTDKFCQDYSQQFDFSKMDMQQIVSLCKPYYIRSDNMNGKNCSHICQHFAQYKV